MFVKDLLKTSVSLVFKDDSLGDASKQEVLSANRVTFAVLGTNSNSNIIFKKNVLDTIKYIDDMNLSQSEKLVRRAFVLL